MLKVRGSSRSSLLIIQSLPASQPGAEVGGATVSSSLSPSSSTTSATRSSASTSTSVSAAASYTAVSAALPSISPVPVRWDPGWVRSRVVVYWGVKYFGSVVYSRLTSKPGPRRDCRLGRLHVRPICLMFIHFSYISCTYVIFGHILCSYINLIHFRCSCNLSHTMIIGDALGNNQFLCMLCTFTILLITVVPFRR